MRGFLRPSAVLLCVTLAAQPRDSALEKALAAHQAGDWAAAESSYRDFLKRAPRAAEIRSNLGAVLARQGKYEGAIAEYKLALSSIDNPAIRLNLALAHYKAGEPASAAALLEMVRDKAPDPNQALILLADCRLQLGEEARVIELLTPVAAQRPDDRAIAYLLGTALVRTGRAADGQPLLDRILRDGDSAEARLLVGAAKFGMADFSGALTEFEKAAQLNPTLASANGYLGRARMATGDTAGAVAAFRAELAANPNDFESNLSLAVILKQDRHHDEARLLLNRALRVRPGNPAVRYQLATLDLAEGNVNGARTGLESLIAEAPEFVEARVSLATVYYRLKRKADGDRQRALVEKLNADLQARQPKGQPQ